jgi:hypothetical protein
LQVKKPLNKLISSRLSTRTIHHNKIPRILGVDGKNFEIDCKRMLLNSTPREVIGGPTDNNAPRSPNRGAEFKVVESFRSKITNKLQIKSLSFSFL